jgi:hypothetical protein
MTTSLLPSPTRNWPLTLCAISKPNSTSLLSKKVESTGSLMLSDGKRESEKPCLRSKASVTRQAWILQSGELYLQALEEEVIQWTSNPAEAMSWLDPNLAAARLQMIEALRHLLHCSRLVAITFKAQIGIHPLDWRYDKENSSVSAE